MINIVQLFPCTRQNNIQELVDRDRKRKLLESLDKMKQALPKFSSVMQVYVKSHSPASKVREAKAVGWEASFQVKWKPP